MKKTKKQITEQDKKDYTAVWSHAYLVCRHYILGQQKGGTGMMPAMPGEQKFLKMEGTHQIYELSSWMTQDAAENGHFAFW